MNDIYYKTLREFWEEEEGPPGKVVFFNDNPIIQIHYLEFANTIFWRGATHPLVFPNIIFDLILAFTSNSYEDSTLFIKGIKDESIVRYSNTIFSSSQLPVDILATCKSLLKEKSFDLDIFNLNLYIRDYRGLAANICADTISSIKQNKEISITINFNQDAGSLFEASKILFLATVEKHDTWTEKTTDMLFDYLRKIY